IFFSLLLGFVISYFLLLRFKRTQKTQTREDRRFRPIREERGPSTGQTVGCEFTG
ncbi:unnamed protein product, partial [Durusdinium trenchii]